MLNFFRPYLCRIAVLLLSASLFIAGCGTGTADHTATDTPREESQNVLLPETTGSQSPAIQAGFDRLTDELFREELSASQLDLHFLLKDPSAFGISGAEQPYAPFTLATLEQDTTERTGLRERLAAFDEAFLTDDQILTKKVLESYLSTEALANGLELYVQPLAPTIGTQAQLPILLSEYAFYTKQDVEDYLELIAGIDEYYAQLLEFEQEKADAGLMASDTTIDHIIESCRSYLLVPGDNFLIDTFRERLSHVPELTDEERTAYEGKNAALLESDFVPAYRALIDGLTALKGTGVNDGGQCGYPDGRRWYEYLARSATGMSFASMDEMLTAMEHDLDASLEEIASLLKQYPEAAAGLDSCAFRQTEPGAILEELKTLTLPQFPELPECSYTFKDVPEALQPVLSPAFYLVSPIDDYRSNTIYINRSPDYSSSDLYPIIAHEGCPGHLYQNVYFHTHCPEKLRILLSFPGYTEGWATYVEHESYLLDNGLAPAEGQLLSANQRATLALSACLDVYINYLGWDRAQVKDFLADFGDYTDETISTIYDTMVETPSNYLSYYVGSLEFRRLRKEAEKQLGRNFDVKTFHTFLLDMGSAPFDVIWEYFDEWIKG